MKRSQWLFAVTVLLLILAIGSWRADFFDPKVTWVSPGDHSILAKKVFGPLPAARQAEFKKMYREPRKVEIPDELEISPACRTLWAAIMVSDLREIEKLPQLQDCKPPPNLATHQDNYRQHCLDKKDTKACHNAAFFYRAYLTEFLTIDLRVDQISDPKILLDKLFAKFLTNPLSAAEVADRLLELQPDYYPAAQAAVLSRIFDLFKKDAKPSPESPELHRVANGIERLSQMNPSDPQNVELVMLVDSIGENSAERVRERAEAFEKESPNSAMAAYYLAWAEYKLQNAEGGARWLAQAQRIAPNDQRINDTVAKVRANPNFYKSKENKERSAFTATFSFTIQSPDLE